MYSLRHQNFVARRCADEKNSFSFVTEREHPAVVKSFDRKAFDGKETKTSSQLPKNAVIFDGVVLEIDVVWGRSDVVGVFRGSGIMLSKFVFLGLILLRKEVTVFSRVIFGRKIRALVRR